MDHSQQRISFRHDIADKLDDNVIRELKEYAMKDLENYNNKLEYPGFSFHSALSEIMSSYITAKNQAFAGHPLGTLLGKQSRNS